MICSSSTAPISSRGAWRGLARFVERLPSVLRPTSVGSLVVRIRKSSFDSAEARSTPTSFGWQLSRLATRSSANRLVLVSESLLPAHTAGRPVHRDDRVIEWALLTAEKRKAPGSGRLLHLFRFVRLAVRLALRRTAPPRRASVARPARRATPTIPEQPHPARLRE